MKVAAVLMSLAVVSSVAGAVRADVHTAGGLAGQCAAEAMWPQTASHAWRNAGAHRRAQIRQTFNADVSQARQLCGQWASAPEAQIGALKLRSDSFLATQSAKYGQAADDHVRRMSRLFASLAEARGGKNPDTM